MKKVLIAALATTLVASPVLAAAPAAAQSRHTQQTVRYKPNGTVVVKKQTVRHAPARANYRAHWSKGQRFNRAEARNYRQINDWRQYQNRRLYAPPRGYQWVQSGNDAVLVALTSGLIGAVLGGVFN
jgi:Ni/Co efflux regulator RcnB